MMNITSPQVAPLESAAARRRILIVEDDADIGELLCDRLLRNGFEPLYTASGEDALVLACRKRPDLIVLDLRLPGLDGLSVCQLLGDDPETAAIPVIVVSGMESPNLVRRSRSAGSRFFLRKPYDPNVLLVLIQVALEGESGW